MCGNEDAHPYDATNDAAPPQLLSVSLGVRAADGEDGDLYDTFTASAAALVRDPEGTGPLSYVYTFVDAWGAVAAEGQVAAFAGGDDDSSSMSLVEFTLARRENGPTGSLFLLVEVVDDFTGGAVACALPVQLNASRSETAAAARTDQEDTRVAALVSGAPAFVSVELEVPCPEVMFTPIIVTNAMWLQALMDASGALKGVSAAALQLFVDAVDECVDSLEVVTQ
jgi:hypothetical protein